MCFSQHLQAIYVLVWLAGLVLTVMRESIRAAVILVRMAARVPRLAITVVTAVCVHHLTQAITVRTDNKVSNIDTCSYLLNSAIAITWFDENDHIIKTCYTSHNCYVYFINGNTKELRVYFCEDNEI